jgi:hypothetical protein
MAKEPFEQFAMPDEVRAFVEQSVSQARTAFDGIAQAAAKPKRREPAPARLPTSRWLSPN